MKKRSIAQKPGYNWARSRLITQAGVEAKRANQRLREIEKQNLESASNAYKYVEKAAFDGKAWTGKTAKGQIKFNTNFRSMTDEQIKKELDQIRNFLNAKTSVTKGVRKKVEKLTDRFNEKLKEEGGKKEYTQQEFTEIMSENLTAELFKIFDPSAVMRLFAEDPSYTKNSEQILSALVAAEGRNLSEMSFSTVVNAFHNFTSNEFDQEETGEDFAPWE